jgi:peptidoglycan hydrolase-like protein with peptidoglycan-binding domain
MARAGAGRVADDDYISERPGIGAFLFSILRESPRDSFAALVAAGATCAILINALFLQSGPHPAPIFANKPAVIVANPAPAPVQSLAVPAIPKPRVDLMAEIQRELARRGFYDGPSDGFYGPKTDAAIRDFEQAAGLRPSAEPNDALLAIIVRSTVKAKPTAVTSDPIAALLSPNKRIVAVQRALADYGYGQIRPTGTYDPETRAAIERFERERKLPVTGQVSDRLTRELSAMTGRPLE